MGPLILDSGVTNENFFPLILSILGIFISIKLLIEAMQQTKEIPEATGSAMDSKVAGEKTPKKMTKKQLILMLDFALFIAAYYFLGFIVAAIVFTFLFMLFFDDTICHPVKKIIISVAIALMVYVLYAILFGVHFN